MGMGASFRPGGAHDVFARHQRRPLVSDVLADQHGDGLMAAIRVAEARRTVETWKRLAARDAAVGVPRSALLAIRLRAAQLALAEAEAALAARKANMKANPDAGLDDDEEED